MWGCGYGWWRGRGGCGGFWEERGEEGEGGSARKHGRWVIGGNQANRKDAPEMTSVIKARQATYV